ncbi:MAG: hypothetical protein IPM50_02645 [Acidobacteriota bacterium]|nr:MAG: hypothetical protein IPM50_02645 [Acidobacteriota bacterium]
MKLRSQVEGLAIPATVAAVLDKDTIVTITADKTVNKAGANATPLGRLAVPAKSSGGIGTVETRCKELIEIKFSGNIAAGALVKMAAADGTTGENVVAAWVSGTDGAERIFGVVWKGANGAVGEVLTF